eukprot:scaffold78_cov265-Pinguiococcus_pyrenoidosus.AAC.1
MAQDGWPERRRGAAVYGVTREAERGEAVAELLEKSRRSRSAWPSFRSRPRFCRAVLLLSLVGALLGPLAILLDESLPESMLAPGDGVPITALVYLLVLEPDVQVGPSLVAVVSSARVWGGWDGDIYLLTNSIEKMAPIVEATGPNTFPVLVPVDGFSHAAKALKAQPFEYLPGRHKRVLYIDSDIVVHKPLRRFLTDTEKTLAAQYRASQRGKTRFRPSPLPSEQPPEWWSVGLFLDCKTHAAGWCDGCNKWHTGVMLLSKRNSEQCLRHWTHELREGVFATDQETMDHVEAAYPADCQGMAKLPSAHILFMKDILGFLLPRRNTFLHFTGLLRRDGQSYLYRRYMLEWYLDQVLVPRILHLANWDEG